MLLDRTVIALFLDKLETELSVRALLIEVSSLPKALKGLTKITGKLSFCNLHFFLRLLSGSTVKVEETAKTNYSDYKDSGCGNSYWCPRFSLRLSPLRSAAVERYIHRVHHRILDLLITEIRKHQIHLLVHDIVHILGKEDPARLGKGL